jgi:hypothetical protein
MVIAGDAYPAAWSGIPIGTLAPACSVAFSPRKVETIYPGGIDRPTGYRIVPIHNPTMRGGIK